MASWDFATSAAGKDLVADELEALGRGPMVALTTAMSHVADRTSLPRQDRSLSGGLREVRETFDGREVRVIYARVNGRLVALHAFEKKTGATPPRALAKARKRLSAYKQRQAK